MENMVRQQDPENYVRDRREGRRDSFLLKHVYAANRAIKWWQNGGDRQEMRQRAWQICSQV